MTRILAIGECMVELAPTDEPDRFKRGYAGDTFNTAWYLRRLLGDDHQVDYFTAVGTDRISDDMIEFLADAGIGASHILRQPDSTVGLYLIHLEDGERSFAYWRGQSAARTLAAAPAPLHNALEGAKAAYFSGITLAILPPADRDNLLAVLGSYRASGGQVIFDPNLRPRLWTSTDDMKGWIMRAAALSDIILPSFDDEARWFGDENPDATARRYQTTGATCVVVKNGADAIVTHDGDVRTTTQPDPVEKIVDSTAAGDSFNAGFMAALFGNRTIQDAVRAGASVSARVISQYGALVASATTRAC